MSRMLHPGLGRLAYVGVWTHIVPCLRRRCMSRMLHPGLGRLAYVGVWTHIVPCLRRRCMSRMLHPGLGRLAYMGVWTYIVPCLGRAVCYSSGLYAVPEILPMDSAISLEMIDGCGRLSQHGTGWRSGHLPTRRACSQMSPAHCRRRSLWRAGPRTSTWQVWGAAAFGSITEALAWSALRAVAASCHASHAQRCSRHAMHCFAALLITEGVLEPACLHAQPCEFTNTRLPVQVPPLIYVVMRPWSDSNNLRLLCPAVRAQTL